MNKIKRRSLYFIVSYCLLTLPAQAQSKSDLTIYTYDSFSSKWGPGPVIKAKFEKHCDCNVKFIGLDSSVGILGRLQIEGETSKADIALGLDTSLMAVAKETNLFTSHGVDYKDRLALPKIQDSTWQDDTFLPFDWGYFAFVYDTEKIKTPPKSMDELVNDHDKLKIVIQDPRTSTPGLGLMLWVNAVYGNKSESVWKKLAPKIVTVTKGWWDAYSMFLEGEADMVLSYSTSPAYHMISEGKNNYAAANFSEGHYLQIEVAGILKSAPQPQLARKFMDFILDDEFQNTIATTNWMYPVSLSSSVPDEFENLIHPTESLLFTPEEIAANRDEWIKTWVSGLSQ